MTLTPPRWLSSRTGRTRVCHAVIRLVLSLLLAALVGAPTWAEDVVEFMSGAKLRGEVVSIDKQAHKLTLRAVVGDQTIKRTYSYAQIHAVTYRNKRYVLTEKTAATAGDDSQTSRSESDVVRLINSAGSTPPAWLESTPLNYPQSLDLDWPLKPEGKWNNQKNVGQYLWDIIYPNSSRWRSGARLVHFLMTRHQGDAARLRRDMKTLGSMYFNLFQDYARAAYWWRKAGVTRDDGSGPFLGQCYWRLGNRAMCLTLLKGRRLYLSAIKVYGAMGRVDDAVKYAERYVRAGGRTQEAYLLAGDACRQAGQMRRAEQYYRQVLTAADARNKQYDKRYDQRAKESIEALQLQELADVQKVPDGTYQGTGSGYAGLLRVRLTVKQHRVTDLQVVEHHEKQFYSALTDTTQQILTKQSVQGIDATSRATITSVAIINATAKALASGARRGGN